MQLINLFLLVLGPSLPDAGVCGMAIIGYILHTTSSWTLVFAMVFVICAAGSLVFVVFGSGKPIVLQSDTNTK